MSRRYDVIGDVIELELINQDTQEVDTSLAIKFCNDAFCLHKNPFMKDYYTISYTLSGLSYFHSDNFKEIIRIARSLEDRDIVPLRLLNKIKKHKEPLGSLTLDEIELLNSVKSNSFN